jgi:hypothetical protein
MSEGSLVFIEFEELLIDSLYIRESVVDEDVASGARIFRVHDRLSRVHDPLWLTSLVKLQAHNLDLLRAQRPYIPGNLDIYAGIGVNWYLGRIVGSVEQVGP